jgi:nucleotidyltransferase/DNA polymerase involved in DNA repair
MTDRTILHVDMDAFYAAVEQRDHPELRGKPVIVGADPKEGRGRGVVSTASYEARKFGVGSAMPISQAWRLCPHGIYRPVDMAKYLEVSRQVMEILRRYTDLVEPVSVDEAFLDVTGSRRAFGSGEDVARALKAAIKGETRLTASVGVAPCKLVAKIASDMRKPDGLVVVPSGTEETFLAPLPVRRLWGVGPKMEEQLIRLGVHTIGDLTRLDERKLTTRLGTHGHDLLLLARGIDDRPVHADSGEAKSLGQEHTYDEDTDDLARLRRTLLDLADGVARRLRSHGLRGRTITLKYRDETFATITRAETLSRPTDSGNTLFRTASKLFETAHRGRRVRLLGIYVTGFGSQLEMFDEPSSPSDRLRDVISERFGDDAIVRASLLRGQERRHPESTQAEPRPPKKPRG